MTATDMKDLVIRTEYIQLDQALKLAGLVGSGGEAKAAIQGGSVLVNGATETSRYNSTRSRCASGLRLNNTEPASAPYMAASPIAISACVRASRRNGDCDCTGI